MINRNTQLSRHLRNIIEIKTTKVPVWKYRCKSWIFTPLNNLDYFILAILEIIICSIFLLLFSSTLTLCQTHGHRSYHDRAKQYLVMRYYATQLVSGSKKNIYFKVIDINTLKVKMYNVSYKSNYAHFLIM